MSVTQQAEENMYERLKNNVYPGRGIALGLSESGGEFIQIYWIMGRSANSRNRIFALKNDMLQTQPLDVSKVENPKLIIYNAMRQVGSQFIVSNGDQTDTIYEHLSQGKTFESAMSERTFEPDAPNFTPRIAGVIDLKAGHAAIKLAIAKKSPMNDNPLHHFFHMQSPEKGLGWCIHTYEQDGNPIPPFAGEPYIVPVRGTVDEIANGFWQVLNEDNKISLAVRAIQIKTGKAEIKILNKYR